MKSKPWFLLLISFLLIVSLIGNYLFYQLYEESYIRLQEVQLDPLGLGQFPEGPAFDADDNRLKVLFFGDSRARAWTIPSDLLDLQFANRGTNAHTSAQCRERFSAHVEAQQPDILVIQMGINDLKTLPLFPGEEQQIIDQCLSNMKQQLMRSQELGITVILTTIFPVGEIPWKRRMVWSEAVDEAVVKVNAHLKQWAEADEDIHLLETAQLLADEDGLVRKEYQRDFLHLNADGYEALNQGLASLLRLSRDQ